MNRVDSLGGRWASVCKGTLLVLFLLHAATSVAQTTSGNSTTGQTLYNTYCDGCHGATVGSSSPAIKNAANAGGIINTAMGNGMGGYTTGSFTATQENDMAAYIATVVTSPNPSLSAVSHNTAKLITLPNIFVNTAYGVFTTGSFSSGASRGSVIFSTSGTSLRATYTPDAGQCGSDTVNYRATNGGAITSNLRSFSVDIADPAAPNITTSASTKTGTYLTALTYTPTSTGGTPYSYAISVGTLPTGLTLNTTTGVISGSPTQSGTFNVTLQARNCLGGNLAGQTSSRAIAFTINKANQAPLTVLINGNSLVGSFTYQSPNGTATLSTTGGSGTGAVTYASSNSAVCTVLGSTLTLVGAGSCTITATKALDANYNVASDTIGVNVSPASQTITFPVQTTTSRSYVQSGTFSVSPVATASSGLAVTYDSNTPAVCSLPGTTSTTVTMLAAGTCTIGANQAGSTNYNAAVEATQNVTINPILPQPPTIGVGVGGNAQAVVNFSAPGNTGGTSIIDYTATCTAAGQTTRTATVVGSPATVLSMVNGVTYSCSVTARNSVGSSAGSGTVMVTPTSSPVITSLNNATFTIGTAANFNVTATGSPTPDLTMTAGTLPSGVTFSPTVGTGTAPLSGTPAAGTAGSYPVTFKATNIGGSSTQSFTLTVQKASQTITFGAIANRVMSPVPFTLTATASSGLAVSLSIAAASTGNCYLLGNSLYMTAVGTCTVLANQAGNTSFNAASQVSRSFTISQGTQLLLWAAQPGATYSPGGSASFGSKAASVDPVDLMTSTGLDPTYVSLTPAICTYTTNAVSILAAGTCTVEASQVGDANYAAATPVTQDIIIGLAPQSISWGAQSNQTFGTGGTFSISPLATGGSSGNAIVYGSSTASVCTVTGTTVTKVAAGTCTLTANQSGDDNYAAAAQVSRSLTIAASTPTAPTATDIMASDAQVTITFDPPSSDGGSAITSYRATCLPGTVTANGSSSPIIVTGLTNGTPYTCAVRAQNSAGLGAVSNSVMATPFLETGANLWTNVCSGCHGAQPAGVRFNAAGTTGAVINYVRSVQPNMLSNNAVQALTLNELAEIAKYIETFVPANSVNTAFNTPVNVDVASHLTLGTVSFNVAEVVTAPLHGSLGAFTGTTVTYTPSPGYVGADTFTYRGNQAAPGVPGDAHTVSINVAAPPAPVITSPAIFSGVFGTPTSYQITATNSPTSYGASGLGAGFSINAVTGLISGTPNAAGSFTVTVAASNAGGTGMQAVDVTVSKASQTITFGAQGGQPYSPGGTFLLSPVATASSSLTVSYSSLSTSVCTISGTTVTIVTAGTCIIAADQSGNANYNAALQVTQSIAISATVPGAPTIGTATAGDTTASISFTPPANNGGSPITSYTAACNPGPVGAGGTASPITVTGLTNSTLYTCAVRATNAAGNSAFSSNVTVTPTATPVAPQIVSANATTFTVGAAGNFTVSATGVPAPALAMIGTLPSGVTFTPGTGALAGTPALGTVGSYPLTVTATGTAPAAMQSFTLTVQKANQSIAFTGPASQAFSVATIPLSATATSGLTVAFASNTTAVCTVSGSTLTLVTVGTCSITASQAGDGNYNAATSVTQGFNVSQAAQTITFATQSVTSRNFVAGSTFPVSPTASASSSLTVLYTSTTPLVCTIAGTTVTMVAPGTCTIAANQSGSANFLAAGQVTQSVVLNATAPGAPTIGTAIPGNGQASIAFTAPANNGGSAITGYTVTCNPGGVSNSGNASPIVVSGLTNNVAYTCSVAATNAIGTGASSATTSVTPLSGQGSTIWQNVCSFCHGSVPIGNQLNAAGTTATVLQYVRNNQTVMKIFGPVQALTLADLADVAAYIATEIPPGDVTTVMNTVVPVSVANHITLTGQVWAAFDSVEIVTPPVHGNLSSFTGTSATYTPANGYVGTDTFTYRGKLNSVHVGDPQTVTITITPPAPSITSAASATGVFGQVFSYQITASNTPTSFDAANLPGGLSVDAMTGLISGTPTVPGSFAVSISATNAGGFGQASLMLQIDRAPQVIVFPAQTSPRTFAAGGTFSISPPATGGLSGNPVVYGSSTSAVCTVSGVTVTIVTAGTCTITASQAGSTNYAAATQVTQDVIINPILPGAPVIGVPTAGNGQASIAFSAPASNGGATITSYTATCGVASASGPASPIIVTGLANGVLVSCSVTATNAAGTGPASAGVNVTPVAISPPGAPVIGAATPGNQQASIAFTAPASNGGAAISAYNATCNPSAITASAANSPIAVTGLTNGVTYTCSVTATNSAGTGAASGTVQVTPISFSGLVKSRKTHAGFGPLDIDIDSSLTINGAITVEPRTGVSGHLLLFQFTAPVTSVTGVSVTNALGNPVGSASVVGVGNNAEVTLTGIPDNQRVLVTLTGVNGNVGASTAIGFLVGDVTSSRSLTGADISAIKSRISQPVGTGNNRLFDINLDGIISQLDVSAAKVRAGQSIP